MAGRRAPSRNATVVAQTPKVSDAQTQRALDVVTEAVKDLQARRHLEQFTATEPGYVPEAGTNEDAVLHADGVWREVTATAIGAVTDVTAGSSKVTVAPTTGSVVVDVVPANFTGIPMAGISFVGTNNRLAKFSGTTLADTTITDTGILVTINNALNVTGTADFDSSLLVNSTLTVNGAVDFDTTLNVDGAVSLNSTLTLSTFTQGSVPYIGVGGLVSQNNAQLFWDAATLALGIGTTAVNTNKLAVLGSGHKDTISGADSATGKTVTMATIAGNNFGTFNTTAATLEAIGGYFDANASRSAGANDLRCVGVRARARSGQTNWALWVSEGEARIDTTAAIGSASFTIDPNTTVHVRTAASGAVAALAGTNIAVEKNGVSYITIKGPAATAKGILFSNPTAADDGGVIYDSSARGIILRAAGATRVTIDSSGNVACTANLSCDGTLTAGNQTTDNHTINGRVALTSTTSTASADSSTFTPSAGTTSALSAFVATNNGTFNTTGGALTEYALRAVISATRSAGASNLTNVALYGTASGGQVNVALQTDAGNVLLNQTGGTFSCAGAATFTSTVSIEGNAAIGNNAADAHTITGILTANGTTASAGQVLTAVSGVPKWGTPNGYESTHLEWNDDWCQVDNLTVAGGWNTIPIGSPPWSLRFNGSSTALNVIADTQRIGVVSLDTGVTTGGYTELKTSDIIKLANGTFIIEATVAVPTLSDSTDGYTITLGAYQANTVDQSNGVYMLYDERNVATSGPNSLNEHKWSIWSCSGGSRTTYLLKTGVTTDESFSAVDTPIAAVTYPSTNVYRFRIVMNSTRCEFYVYSGGAWTKIGNLNTNLPTDELYVGLRILKNAGTTARQLHLDQTRIAMDLTSAR